ncbi:DUF3023 domain-containing protein [Ehrlichia japonica]|uniref:DUF3023 domain-containing protein n=1 Tax=Ehrlichia japonica TaxID=391036 RepID=UPI000A077CBD
MVGCGYVLLKIKDNKWLTAPGTGDTLFLLKGYIPSEAVRRGPELRKLVGREYGGHLLVLYHSICTFKLTHSIFLDL